MSDFNHVDIGAVIDSLVDGIYVCDLDRRITFWSESAERITGWSADEVVGRQCFDNVLCHIDKDGHKLCGEEFCPLHRSIVTGNSSQGSLLVYAKGRDGQRVPMLVSVSPMQDEEGNVIGGLETFRDASATVHDLERAQAIQQLALQHDVPHDARVSFSAHYVPYDFIGGDYYAVKQIDDDRYALMLADVMGHGVAAALYTMHLSSLWDRYFHLLTDPVAFAGQINNELIKVVKTDESFASAVVGVVDLERNVFRFTSAGGPPVLKVHGDGTYESIEADGVPLAIMEDAPFDERVVDIASGDGILLFSDGANEVSGTDGQLLGCDGVARLLKDLGYPQTPLQMNALEESLLKYSNAIRLEDDLTVLEARFHSTG